MKIEKISIDKLLLDPANARKHGKKNLESIKGSLAKFGQQKPIVVNADNVIVAGNGTMQAAKELGWKEINIVRTDLKGSDITAFGIADNRTSELAEWDDDVLKELLEGLKAEDFDLSAIGFDDDEFAEMMGGKGNEGLTDEDAVPEVPEEPKTKLGDIYMLGNHRLMCGDSTSIDAVERLMAGQKADFVLTDPPYNQETDGGFKGEIGASLKKQSGDIAHLCSFEPETVLPILPIAHKKGVMNATIFCNKDLVPRYLNWAVDNKYSFNILVWKKPSAIPLGGSYQPDIEYCLVFRRAAKFNTKQQGVSYSKVLEHKRETGLHPTMKPVDMLENQVKIVSDSGDLCLDLFGGSGSTLIACEKTGRKAFLMELDPKYCDVIIKRWEDFTGKKAELLSS
jgi:16S rRNA G966 N2-methylase RsmD